MTAKTPRQTRAARARRGTSHTSRQPESAAGGPPQGTTQTLPSLGNSGSLAQLGVTLRRAGSEPVAPPTKLALVPLRSSRALPPLLTTEPGRRSLSTSSLLAGAARSAGGGGLRFALPCGNNSALIRRLLRSRPGWVQAEVPGTNTNATAAGEAAAMAPSVGGAHLLWTQYLHAGFLETMAAERTPSAPSSGSGRGSRRPLAPKRLHNHVENNELICTKMGLRDSLMAFYLGRGLDPFAAAPLTFVVRSGAQDPEFIAWRRAFDQIQEESGQRLWLVKPGGWSNRGCGIQICDRPEDVQAVVDSQDPGKLRGCLDSDRLWVVQKYIERPLLIHRRKFDIRAYCLVSQEPHGGPLVAYFYHDAYLRTASAEYSAETFDRLVHLNNDAVQSKGENYGRYEPANKLSLDDFQAYLDSHCTADEVSVRGHIVPQIKCLMADCIRAAVERGLHARGLDCFEVLGFDLMVDAAYRVWLIEVNSNPCLELCNAHLAELIPAMLDEALALTLDRRFPEALGRHVPERRGGWELVFSSDERRSPSSKDVACVWLPEAERNQELASLGRDMLKPRRVVPGVRPPSAVCAPAEQTAPPPPPPRDAAQLGCS